MNYRHIYHAGNICDVAKHAALTLLIERLKAKETPFCVIDSHAGVGLYDLHDERAGKTNEAADGILKLISAAPIPALAAYYNVLQKLNPGWTPGATDGFHIYPGSPLLAQELLRAADRLEACELHPEDVEELRRNFRRAPNAHIHHRNGYEALRGFLPPAEKRGVVLIDPPYEQPQELENLVAALTDSLKRWPQGYFMIWYPIKERPTVWRFHEALAATGIRKQLAAEFIYEDETRTDRLNGSGLIFINPPWKLDEELATLFPALHNALGTPIRESRIKWLVGE